jgi:imidazolonepropionase-like amidohydrolase
MSYRRLAQICPEHQRMGCCLLHLVAGGFPAGIGEVDAPTAQAPSFVDGTPRSVSSFCTDTLDDGADLFEVPQRDQAVAVRNVTVVPMDGSVHVGPQTIVVRNGRIEAIVPDAQWDSRQYPGAMRVDGRGKFAIPGLSDMHAHPQCLNWTNVFARKLNPEWSGERFALPTGLLMLLYLAAGVTRFEVMAGDRDMLRLRDLKREGRIIAPTMQVGSPMVDGPTPMQAKECGYQVADAAGGRRAAEEARALGYDFIKPYSALPAEAYDAMMATCHRLGLRVMGHVPKAVTIADGLARGQQGIAHASEYSGYQTPDLDAVRRLAAQSAKAGVWVQATVTVCHRVSTLGDSNFNPAGVADIEFYPPVLAHMFRADNPSPAMPKLTPEMQQAMKGWWPDALAITRVLKEEGVQLLTGTDSPNPWVIEGFSVHEELRHFVDELGMTPLEALSKSTSEAARYHGEEGTAGVIAAGARADLLLLDADPRASITATRAIDTVIVGGRVLTSQHRHEGLDRICAAFDAMRRTLAAA